MDGWMDRFIYWFYFPRLPNTLWGGIWTPKTYLKHLLRRYLEDYSLFWLLFFHAYIYIIYIYIFYHGNLMCPPPLCTLPQEIRPCWFIGGEPLDFHDWLIDWLRLKDGIIMIRWSPELSIAVLPSSSHQKSSFEILQERFLKCWYPTTIGFPTKNDHFGVFWGYHRLRKHPYIYIIYII